MIARLTDFTSICTRPAKEGPTIHSLAHSLATTLDFVRQKLLECPPTNGNDIFLTQIWTRYEPYEELLVSLADLCGRVRPFDSVTVLSMKSDFFQSESCKTTDYLHLDSDPVPLLSRLYENLALHYERQSAHLVRSVMGFILSSTSHEYIQHVAHSIGFGGQPKPKTGKMKANWFNGANEFEDDEDEDDEDHILDLLDAVEAKFLNFFPQVAQPHACCTEESGSAKIRATRPCNVNQWH